MSERAFSFRHPELVEGSPPAWRTRPPTTIIFWELIPRQARDDRGGTALRRSFDRGTPRARDDGRGETALRRSFDKLGMTEGEPPSAGASTGARPALRMTPRVSLIKRCDRSPRQRSTPCINFLLTVILSGAKDQPLGKKSVGQERPEPAPATYGFSALAAVARLHQSLRPLN
jgi:hypothetical protein